MLNFKSAEFIRLSTNLNIKKLTAKIVIVLSELLTILPLCKVWLQFEMKAMKLVIN